MSVSTSSIYSSLSVPKYNNDDKRLIRQINGNNVTIPDMQTCRLVDWIVDTLSPMLGRIVSTFLATACLSFFLIVEFLTIGHFFDL